MEEQKYTISFINGTPGLVVRGDTAEEMETSIRAVLPVFSKFKNAIEKGYAARAGVSTAIPQTSHGVCPTHNVPFIFKSGVSKKTGQQYAFWSCPAKNMDGSFCNSKPSATVQAPQVAVHPVPATPVATIDSDEEVIPEDLPF